MLMIDGRIHPKFNRGSESKLNRNGVGVDADGDAVFVISEDPVNLYAIATFFRDTLGCRNALYFDGVVSSLYSPKMKRNDFRMDLGPIVGEEE